MSRPRHLLAASTSWGLYFIGTSLIQTLTRLRYLDVHYNVLLAVTCAVDARRFTAITLYVGRCVTINHLNTLIHVY